MRLGLELLDRLSIDPWRTLPGPDLLPGFPDQPLVDIKRLPLNT
jgi:hypothetical protein